MYVCVYTLIVQCPFIHSKGSINPRAWVIPPQRWLGTAPSVLPHLTAALCPHNRMGSFPPPSNASSLGPCLAARGPKQPQYLSWKHKTGKKMQSSKCDRATVEIWNQKEVCGLCCGSIERNMEQGIASFFCFMPNNSYQGIFCTLVSQPGACWSKPECRNLPRERSRMGQPSRGSGSSGCQGTSARRAACICKRSALSSEFQLCDSSSALLKAPLANSGTDRQKRHMAVPERFLCCPPAELGKSWRFYGESKGDTERGRTGGIQRIDMGTKAWWDS